MNMPVRHRPGSLLESTAPSLSWGGPITSEIDELFQRMEHLLESAGAAPSLGAGTHWAPLADMHETDDAYIIEAELPGVKREDIDVEVSGQGLHISGEYRQSEREGVLRRTTRRTGSFEYRALLPADVKAEEVTASLADGVLTVTVPKTQATMPRHIDITT
ncbi:Hsp20/alpha crystallin family protein [Streptomyces sp. TM32]|uniref:Hsp20/alpha crystallin family protein n=1 Tax=Streptomyces sp. TM32 TaxID=1652669 RepID=UPI0010128A54|nr:Hsp20/alpha crystallin family protein [Streptomyces sp. TM32]RXS87156.1 Hsp20/alpha crystallin family protein [Streptomyces sp. TM32]